MKWPRLAALFLWSVPAFAEPLPASPEAPPRTVSAPELDRSIDHVLTQREYAWRLPRRPKAAPTEDGLAAQLKGVRSWFRQSWLYLQELIRKLIDWLTFRSDAPTKGVGAARPVEVIAYVLLGVGALLLAWAWWRRHRRRPATIAAVAVVATPDLHDEDVSADELPEDRWLQLARELLEKGELRLALRALYLAALAHLGQRQLVAIARHKSNLDYRCELARRATQRAALVSAFAENVAAFERGWYGRSAVTAETLAQFKVNLEVIRSA